MLKQSELGIFEHVADRRVIVSLRQTREQPLLGTLSVAFDTFTAEQNSECPRLQIHRIVMASHGRTGLGRWVYGSVADKVLRAADRTVVLVRAGRPIEMPQR